MSKHCMIEIAFNNKGEMHFTSIIRLPNFVIKEDFDWTVEEATKKKNSVQEEKLTKVGVNW